MAEDRLNRLSGASSELEARVASLHGQFRRAQEQLAEIGRLCHNAEASVRRSQGQLNRSHREFHALCERTRHLLAGQPSLAGASTAPAPSGTIAQDIRGAGAASRPGAIRQPKIALPNDDVDVPMDEPPREIPMVSPRPHRH
eukprot:gnl/MRDRNA2_/MRDRNA2_77735_c0_seq1.p1 gnl/MRDRNA2_/MRDRNA2_77735_c0~~gnl/MRDRNA2_/MRDRNA2_77735_c0_seq1.p1  ORF type:complete len:142 (+),score=20.77 gnl/MRDRNA2_/MRDRNA2_77735_c0_seq1:42-467(+)